MTRSFTGWRWAPSQDFSAHISSITGPGPGNPRPISTRPHPPKTLGDTYPTAAGKAAIHAGLTDLVEELLEKRQWIREDGTAIPPGRMMIDSKYETDTVKAFCSPVQASSDPVARPGVLCQTDYELGELLRFEEGWTDRIPLAHTAGRGWRPLCSHGYRTGGKTS